MLLHEVITTEKVPFAYRVAGLGSRFLAWFVDAVFIVVLDVAGIMAGSVLDSSRPGLGQALVYLWVFSVTWGYFLLFEWLWHGQTPGKRMLGIRVIQWRGTGIAFYESALRNLLRFVDSLPFFYAVGVAVAACNRCQRRLGDFAANTLIVHVDRKAKPIQTLYEQIAGAGFEQESLVRHRLAQLDRGQKQTLLDLCLRKEQLRAQERARLFSAVADYFKNRLAIPAARFQSDEKFVLQLVALLGGDT
jgi:uncharacterized RDD family membrane protein YckC